MCVLEDIRGASLWWGELLELWEGVKGNVLVDGATWGQGRSDKWGKDGIRKLAALVDLALEVAFLIEEILETEVCLVHVLACICGSLFVCTGGGVGGPVEGLETSEEGAGAYVECSWVCICMRWGDKVLKVFYGGIRVGHGGTAARSGPSVHHRPPR